MYRLLVLALAVIWPLTAAGAFYTGKDLLDWCDGTNVGEPRDSVDLYNTCVVYLAGVIDTDETISGWGYKSGHVCPPQRRHPGAHAPRVAPLRQGEPEQVASPRRALGLDRV